MFDVYGRMNMFTFARRGRACEEEAIGCSSVFEERTLAAQGRWDCGAKDTGLSAAGGSKLRDWRRIGNLRSTALLLDPCHNRLLVWHPRIWRYYGAERNT